MISNFNLLRDAAVKCEQKRVAVAAAADVDVLMAVKEASELGFADFTLVGDAGKIKSIADELSFALAGVKIIDEPNDAQACLLAVTEVSQNRAQLLMKGLVSTSVILKAVLNKEVGLRTGKLLSHIAILEAERFNKLLIMTDGGMNIKPDLQQKVGLIQNAVVVANRVLQIDVPKVAPLCAVEKVNPAMEATLDAAVLKSMNERGQIPGCIVAGPLNLNGAISKEAAEHIGLTGPVAGQADILLVPNIEAGNILYKGMVYFAGARCAGLIVGASKPIILTSRADSHDAKVNSIAAAVLLA